MKSCPKCQRTFPNDAGFCPADGTALTAASLAPAAPSDDPRIGTRLCGRYELRRVVADGGMGRVYEGIDKQTDSRVAVKILHPDVAKDEIALERFKREYEINASLPHEHIVNVVDFQRDSVADTWILVMEFLDGEELRYALKREKVLPPERVVRMMAQVAIGLDEAHARGFIHRDLKPDNVFLVGTREGDVVKLLDFGSAKDTGNQSNKKKLTVLGTTIGSPYYMAPEQAQGLETIDPRADIFALGAVLYECITGEVPFSGTNGPSILLAILTKDPAAPSTKSAKVKYPIAPAMDDVIELCPREEPEHPHEDGRDPRRRGGPGVRPLRRSQAVGCDAPGHARDADRRGNGQGDRSRLGPGRGGRSFRRALARLRRRLGRSHGRFRQHGGGLRRRARGRPDDPRGAGVCEAPVAVAGHRRRRGPPRRGRGDIIGDDEVVGRSRPV